MSQLEIGGFPPVAAVAERGDRDAAQQRNRGRKHPAGTDDSDLVSTQSGTEDENHTVDDTA